LSFFIPRQFSSANAYYIDYDYILFESSWLHDLIYELPKGGGGVLVNKIIGLMLNLRILRKRVWCSFGFGKSKETKIGPMIL
jgi:hypothetical protein